MPELVKTLVEPAKIAGVRSRGLFATPLIVFVRLVPERFEMLEFIIGCTPVDTPLTSDSKVLPIETSELELIRLTLVPATPLTVVKRLLP